MPKLADSIVVTSTPDKKWSFTINGEEFPWYIDQDGASITIEDNDMPGVIIRILAKHVSAEHGTSFK